MFNRLFKPVINAVNEIKQQIIDNPGATTIAALLMKATLATAQKTNNVTTFSPTPAADPANRLYPALAIFGGILIFAGCCYCCNICTRSNSRNDDCCDAVCAGVLIGEGTSALLNNR